MKGGRRARTRREEDKEAWVPFGCMTGLGGGSARAATGRKDFESEGTGQILRNLSTREY